MVRADAEAFVRERCFRPAHDAASTGRVGVELEWLPLDARRPRERARPHVLKIAAESCTPLPSGSTLSFEPGGQLELSTAPAPSAAGAVEAVAIDAALVDAALVAAGVRLAGVGYDPCNEPARLVSSPRYLAMQAYFDEQGDAGRSMMCNSASIQLNLDLEGPTPADDRWNLAHALGPVVAAAFANSPFQQGVPSRCKSYRLAIWDRIDRSRTAPVGRAEPGADPAAEYTRYALDARVMLIRSRRERYEPVCEPLTFGQWIDTGHSLGHPTVGDFEYHLTTLFPPVRARGRLELRGIDAQHGSLWRAAIALSAAMFEHPDAAFRCALAVAREPTHDLWEAAARDGLEHPVLGRTASACFRAALDVLPEMSFDSATLDAAAEFVDRYVERGRCPADDLLDTWRTTSGLPTFGEPAWT